MSRPGYAKTFRVNIWHIIDHSADTWTTKCGKDARLMNRFNPGDLPSGTRHGRICPDCRESL